MRYFRFTSLIALLIVFMTISIFAQTPPRIMVQKLILEDGDIMDLVTNTGNTHAPDYILKAMHLETGVEIATDTGETPVENLRINQVDAGFVAAIINQSAFPDVWLGEHTVKLTIIYSPTGQIAVKNVLIPPGTSAIIMADEGEEMIVPPWETTLPVELSSFTASVTGNQFVELQWISETETNLLGYNVYRGMVENVASAVAVNPYVIPATNSSSTAEYLYVDEEVLPGNTYYYWLQSTDLDLTSGFHGPVSITLEEEPPLPPEVYTTKLHQNYPNPFNPTTTIKYSISDDTEMMELKIYNIAGQLVRTLKSGAHSKGEFTLVWDGRDDKGKAMNSGIYFYRLSTPTYNKTFKMLMVK